MCQRRAGKTIAGIFDENWLLHTRVDEVHKLEKRTIRCLRPSWVMERDPPKGASRGPTTVIALRHPASLWV
jgi:hypothetical protein